MSNLPPGVRVSDLPGNRPLDVAWERYYVTFDTHDNRSALADALEDSFDWFGQERTPYLSSQASDAVWKFVEDLSSEAMLALYRGLYGKDIPPFDVWYSEQDQPEEPAEAEDTSGYEQPYTDGPPYGRTVGPDDPR